MEICVIDIHELLLPISLLVWVMMVTEYEALKYEFLRECLTRLPAIQRRGAEPEWVSQTTLPVRWWPLVATCRVSKLKDDTLECSFSML